MATAPLRLLLGGDLMLGRGIDQVMAQHCDPSLHEPVVRDARQYVQLAECRNGPIAPPLAPIDLWGDALAWMNSLQPHLRIVNLETAITNWAQPWPHKGVHYRMHPTNTACLREAGIDACCLANNHALDWGYNGLADTLRNLQQAGIKAIGAGLTVHQAQAPARLAWPGGGDLLLFAWALPSSGVPAEWAVTPDRPGVALLNGIDVGSVKWMMRCICRQRRPQDRVVVSLHWGANWVSAIPEQHRWLAHQLIDLAGVDVVYGHSSHHALPLELYRDRLIFYGCGDLINDYEGLPAHGPWRSDLVCLYALELDSDSVALRSLVLHPFQLRRFQLGPIDAGNRRLLGHQIGLESAPLGWHCRADDALWRLERSIGPAASAELDHRLLAP